MATTATTKLITNFTTYFGDTLNGLWVTWSHDVTSPGGTKMMGIKLQANLYSAAKDLFLFGQTLNPSTADAAILVSNKIKPSTGWDYCIAGTTPETKCPDASGVWMDTTAMPPVAILK